jgi:NAD+-dependent secondary alcohol dehydrogenase Adh1
MKVVRVVGYHKPLQLDEASEPRIEGPLDVIVKIGAVRSCHIRSIQFCLLIRYDQAGVCRTDIHILEGQWEAKSGVTLPYTIGHENAGWIHAIGDAVSGLKIGDKVILHPLVTCGLCRACRFGDDVHCENSSFPGINSDVSVAPAFF